MSRSAASNRARPLAAAGRSPPAGALDQPGQDASLPLVQALLAWYRANKRPLPWRRWPLPYHIWLAEIMLQQTRMETAVPRWRAFLAQFPTIAALAAASVHEVCDAWAGLGYYSRARNLHKTAQLLVAQHGGELPLGAANLAALPGIGPYTAGAIASIAQGEAAPLVDGNVERVLSRLGRLQTPYASAAGRKLFWQRATSLVRQAATVGAPGDFNQALMELGAEICLPKQPLCARCPVQPWCSAEAYGEQAQLPVKLAKAAPQPLALSFVLHWRQNQLLLVRRPLRGLWAGLWEPPCQPGVLGEGAEGGPDDCLGLRARGFLPGAWLGSVAHVLTHRLVTAHVYRCEASKTPAGPAAEERAWVADLSAWPMSTLARKVIALGMAAGNA